MTLSHPGVTLITIRYLSHAEQPTPATLASSLFLRQSEHCSSSQPVPLLIPLPEMPFLDVYTARSLTSFRFYSNNASERSFLTTQYK